MILTSLNIDTSPIWGAMAIGGIGLTYSSSYALSNIIGTISIFFSDCHRIGDLIMLNLPEGSGGSQSQIQGTVDYVDLLYTKIKGFDGNYITVPNSYFATNVARVWRSSKMDNQMFYFFFSHLLTFNQYEEFKIKFQNLLLKYPELNKNESYLYFFYGDFSTVRCQCILTKSDKEISMKGPKFLHNLVGASQDRAETNPNNLADKIQQSKNKIKKVLKLNSKGGNSANNNVNTNNNNTSNIPNNDANNSTFNVKNVSTKNNSSAASSSFSVTIEDEDIKEKAEEEFMEEEEQKEHIQEELEEEIKGKRLFFKASQDFYVELHDWCKQNKYPPIETMLYT